MAVNCCNLVGNFDINLNGVISVSSKGDTPVQLYTDGTNNVITVAPSTGTLSITAYASEKAHDGCAGKAGVSINWMTRVMCGSEFKNVYMFGGPGKSHIQGDVGGLVGFPSVAGIANPVNQYEIIDASSSSGPAALYTKDIQYDGFGLIFYGDPISIDTTEEAQCIRDMGSYGIGGYGECMLQSISLTCTPAQIPTVSYDFIYSISY